MENLEDDKGVCEISRIPSPSSVSSIHSVRPLEWDSGADIGYRCKVSSSLSTVERMALVRGTVNLLETCQPATATKTFSPPLAHSSPFVSNVHAPGRSSVDGDKPAKRLVDYTIYDDDSFRKVSSNCKSLDDLRRAARKTDSSLACKCTSRSSNNVATPKSSCHLSTSSLVTILGSGKYSNKAVQVNEGSLTKPSSKSNSTSTSGIHPSTISTENPTYTIEGDKNPSQNTSDESYNCQSRSRTTNRSQSNGNSSDKGSFEYVRGSVYDVRDGSRKSNIMSDSDVDTLCSEVVDGVELVTKYVNNLRLSNKSRVIRKIVLALASNLNTAESSQSSNLVNNGEGESENQTGKPTLSNDLAVSNRAVLSSNRTSSGDIPVTSSSINNSVSISGVSRTVSEISSENHFNRGLKCRKSKSSDSSTNIGPLKEFLEKERETQLLWIKSGIDHLNNLKKLYQSQKLLKENLRSLRKRQTIEITSVRTNSSQKRSPISQSRTSDTSSKCQFSRNKVDHSSVSTETSHRSNKIEISRTSSAMMGRFVAHSSNKKRTQNCSNHHKRNNKLYEECVENKENISQNSSHPRSNEIRPKLKPPVSYTVLFDKKPSYFPSQNYTVKDEIRNEVNKENWRRNVCRKKHGVSKSSTKPGLTLHDYLLQNKPEYVNKAESRRKCLEKISKLRYLRDQNRGELIATLDEPEKVNCIVPPPLSIIRIFDDRAIKQSTARKYQQLPEVQNKKLELKREENFRRNRIMAKVFTKKLQKKVLKGQVNLSNTVNLISF